MLRHSLYTLLYNIQRACSFSRNRAIGAGCMQWREENVAQIRATKSMNNEDEIGALK